MTIRDRVTAEMKAAMKAKEPLRVSTLRLINAAIKDREIAERGAGKEGALGEDVVLQILSKMVKQRQESARVYEEGGRLEMAAREQDEVEIIEEFLPKPLTEDEVTAAINAAIAEVGAGSLRDMGKVMGILKGAHAGRMDFGAVGPRVKAALGG